MSSIETPNTDTPMQTLYKRMLTLHHTALLVHGPGVAQGVALAIREAVDVMPELGALKAVQEWAESTPAARCNPAPFTTPLQST